jgi:AsmA protein
MPGTALLTPATVAQLTGGKASVSQPVPVKFRLVGPATAPTVADLDLKDAVASIVSGAAAGALGNALGVNAAGAEPKARAAAREQRHQAQQQAQDAAKKARDEAESKLRGLFGR